MIGAVNAERARADPNCRGRSASRWGLETRVGIAEKFKADLGNLPGLIARNDQVEGRSSERDDLDPQPQGVPHLVGADHWKAEAKTGGDATTVGQGDASPLSAGRAADLDQ